MYSNLYMRDYVKEHPNATLDDFRVAYAKVLLDSEKHKVYTFCSLYCTWTDTSGHL